MSFHVHTNAFGATVYRGRKYCRSIPLVGHTGIAVLYPVPALAMVSMPGIEGFIDYTQRAASYDRASLAS